MYYGIDQEIVHSEATLVSVGVYLIRILHLIRKHLMQLTSFEFHLLLVELVF